MLGGYLAQVHGYDGEHDADRQPLDHPGDAEGREGLELEDDQPRDDVERPGGQSERLAPELVSQETCGDGREEIADLYDGDHP